jgi:hypothetical protein
MVIDYLVAVLNLANIILGGYFLTGLLHKKLKLNPGFSVLAAALMSPFLLSLFLYFLFSILPGQTNIFYIAIIFSGPILLLGLYHPVFKIPKLTFPRFDFFTKMITLLLGFLILICALRIFFWPINWDDQIYYIEQAYAFAQEKSVKTFEKRGLFDNGILRYVYNPAIRPGLTLIYSQASLFSNRTSMVMVFSKLMTAYFLVIFMALIFYVNRLFSQQIWCERGLITNLLVLSTYQFINYSVQGFKELPMLCLTILYLISISYFKNNYSKLKIIFLGVLLGLLAYINISGSLLALILLLIYVFFNRSALVNKIKVVVCLLGLILIFSGGEFLYAVNWALTGGVKDAKITQVIHAIVSEKHEDAPVITNIYKKTEFNSYKIFNVFDSYTKGKLQGFFQLNYYGLVFPLFLVIIITNFKNLVKNRFPKLWLIFIMLYYIILIDIFNINPSRFAYVTTVSHKYTVFIIPFVAILIGDSWRGLKKQLNKISLKKLYLSLFGFGLFAVFIIKPNIVNLSKIVFIIVPLLNSPEYYIRIINLGINTFSLFVMFFLVVGGIIYLKLGRNTENYWKQNSLSCLTLVTVLFFFPGLFFFHTNYGLDRTLFRSFTNTETKLSLIKGWENSYGMINYLNRLPNNSKILFSDQSYQLMALYLKFPSSRIYVLNNSPSIPIYLSDIKKEISLNKINYILVNSGKYPLEPDNLLFANADRAVYKTEFTN